MHPSRLTEALSGERYAKGRDRLFASLPLVLVVLFSAWLGGAKEAGYFVGAWALGVFALAALLFVTSATGWLRITLYPWSTFALVLFAAYATWMFASLLWAPNRGAAWLGAGQTLLYLLAFWIAIGLLALGASRRWVLLASVLGPAIVALFTLLNLTSRTDDLFKDNRLFGTVQYYNGEAAFLLVPFWVAVYLAGSRQVNPALRGVVLAGATICMAVAVLAQSRGAMVGMAVSLPVFFAVSGQRLRGFLALVPMAVILSLIFPNLNGVYLAFVNGGDPVAELDRLIPIVGLCAAGAAIYGLGWGLIDRRWEPSRAAVRVSGAIVLGGCIVVLAVGALAVGERVGDPVAWSQQKWEAFKNNDRAGQQQSRYLSAGSGRYGMWEVAWRDFVSHPVLGVGTNNYEATYYRLRDEPHPRWVRQAHSLPLEVLAERGAVGGALFFGFLATCIATGLVRRLRHLNAEGKGQVGALAAAVTYWFVHSSAEWFWQLPAITLPVIVYLAVLVAPWNRTTDAPSGWPLRTVGVAVAVTTVVAVLPLYVADRHLQRSEATQDPQVAMQALYQARRANPVDPLLAQREAELALRTGDTARAEDAYRRTARLNPEHFAPYYLLALLKEQQGARGEALELYRKALSLNPLDKDVRRHVTELESETS